jgi:hypothetical protein
MMLIQYKTLAAPVQVLVSVDASGGVTLNGDLTGIRMGENPLIENPPLLDKLTVAGKNLSVDLLLDLLESVKNLTLSCDLSAFAGVLISSRILLFVRTEKIDISCAKNIPPAFVETLLQSGKEVVLGSYDLRKFSLPKESFKREKLVISGGRNISAELFFAILGGFKELTWRDCNLFELKDIDVPANMRWPEKIRFEFMDNLSPKVVLAILNDVKEAAFHWCNLETLSVPENMSIKTEKLAITGSFNVSPSLTLAALRDVPELDLSQSKFSNFEVPKDSVIGTRKLDLSRPTDLPLSLLLAVLTHVPDVNLSKSHLYDLKIPEDMVIGTTRLNLTEVTGMQVAFILRILENVPEVNLREASLNGVEIPPGMVIGTKRLGFTRPYGVSASLNTALKEAGVKIVIDTKVITLGPNQYEVPDTEPRVGGSYRSTW